MEDNSRTNEKVCCIFPVFMFHGKMVNERFLKKDPAYSLLWNIVINQLYNYEHRMHVIMKLSYSYKLHFIFPGSRTNRKI